MDSGQQRLFLCEHRHTSDIVVACQHRYILKQLNKDKTIKNELTDNLDILIPQTLHFVSNFNDKLFMRIVKIKVNKYTDFIKLII